MLKHNWTSGLALSNETIAQMLLLQVCLLREDSTTLVQHACSCLNQHVIYVSIYEKNSKYRNLASYISSIQSSLHQDLHRLKLDGVVFLVLQINLKQILFYMWISIRQSRVFLAANLYKKTNTAPSLCTSEDYLSPLM